MKRMLQLVYESETFKRETTIKMDDALVLNTRTNDDGELTTESGFITSVKDFFLNAIHKIKSVLTFGLKNVDLNTKYINDKVEELRMLNKNFNVLSTKKFSDIENIQIPIMMGMKPDYRVTAFELNNIINTINVMQPIMKEFNELLTKLIINQNGIRLSSDSKIFNSERTLFKIEERISGIIGELTEVRKPKDLKLVKEVFSNISNMKDIRDSYIKAYQETLKFDLNEYNKNIVLMGELLDSWINTLHGDSSEVKSSSNMVYIVKTNTQLFANITTSIGIYMAFLNQTSSFFISNIKILTEGK